MKKYVVKDVDGVKYEIEIGGEYFYHGNDVEVVAVDSIVVFNYLTGECTGEEDCCSVDEFVYQNPECEISEED